MTIVTISLTTQQMRENLCSKIAVAANSATSRTARPERHQALPPWAATDGSLRGSLEESPSAGRLRSFTTRARAPRHLALFKFRLDREHCFAHDPALGRYVARQPRPVSTRTTAIATRAHAPWHDPDRRRARRKREKRQRSSAAARMSRLAQLIELIDPLQEVAKIRSNFFAHSGRKPSENICLMSAAHSDGGDGASSASCRSAGRYRLETRS
jgi:hypothetical protein